MSPFKIFIVEDDEVFANLIYKHLSLNQEFEIEVFHSGKDCLENLHKSPSLIAIDFSLSDMNGKELLKKIRTSCPDANSVFLSGYEDVNAVNELLKKEGAFDYIVKGPDTLNRLENSIRLFRENLSLKRENELLLKEVDKKYNFYKTAVGKSESLTKIFELIEKASTSSIPVSIQGEYGTEKELVAKAIHFNSERRIFPFITVNIGSIPKELLEYEFFGQEKSIEAGVLTSKAGVFEEACHGTLFINDISLMSANMQKKIFRALQEKQVKRIGNNKDVKIDCRIITATGKDLSEEVRKGAFRADLFYRLMGLSIQLPPLRERRVDIPLFADFFAKSFCLENSRSDNISFSTDAIKKLIEYQYPGNIHELKACVELAIIMSEGGHITPDVIKFDPVNTVYKTIVEDSVTLEEQILNIVKSCLEKNNNRPSIAARKLGISRATVYKYIKLLEDKKSKL